MSDEYVNKMWNECLDGCAGDESQARQQYAKIMESVTRQLKRNKQASSSCSLDDGELPVGSQTVTEEEEDSSDNQSNSQSNKKQLLWEKPGVLSRRVGVKQSVLRTLAKAAVVQTMVSPGGHRLFNVASVMRYMASTANTPVSKPASDRLPPGQRQLLVYVRIDGARQEQAQLEALSDRIRSRFRKRYQDSCTKAELQSGIYILELDPDEDRPQPGQRGREFPTTPGTRRLLQSICNRDHVRSLVVLRSAEDISLEPSMYAFFLVLCRSMGASVEIVTELFN